MPKHLHKLGDLICHTTDIYCMASLFERQQPLQQRDSLSCTFKTKSLLAHLKRICFVIFSYFVYTHSRGIIRFHRGESFIQKELRSETNQQCLPEGWVEILWGVTCSRKSEANCLFNAVTPVLSSGWPWMNYLTSPHFCLLSQNKNSDIPHRWS